MVALDTTTNNDCIHVLALIEMCGRMRHPSCLNRYDGLSCYSIGRTYWDRLHGLTAEYKNRKNRRSKNEGVESTTFEDVIRCKKFVKCSMRHQ